MTMDAFGGNGAFEIVGALFTRCGTGRGILEPRVDVMLEPSFVQFVDEEKLGLRPNRLGHVYVGMTIQQVVQPRRPGAGRARNQESRALSVHAYGNLDQSNGHRLRLTSECLAS